MYEPRFTELFIQNTGVLIHLLYIKHLLITNTFFENINDTRYKG